MNQIQWLELVLEVVSIGGGIAVVSMLYRLLKNSRHSSATFVMELFGVLLFAAGLFYTAGIARIWWPDMWLAPILKTIGSIAVILASIALARLLPRAIAFRDRELLLMAADELKQSKDRFERALRGASSGLWEWNIEANELWFSPRYRELLGYSDENEFPNSFETWEQAVHYDDRAWVLEAVNRHLRDHEDFEIEHRLKTKAGEYRWFSNKGIAIRGADGEPCLMSGSIQDINECKRLQQASRKLDEYAAQKHKMESLGELAGCIAHEFNNFLQAIGGQLQFAEQALTPDSPAADEIESAIELVDQATRVTSRLLTFRRQQNTHRQQTRPNRILTQVEMVLRPLLSKQITLNLKKTRCQARLLVDPISIQQALINLCINARDAMPAGGTIILGTEERVFKSEDLTTHLNHGAGKYISLSVTDNGHGIPLEIQKKLFDPFFTTKAPGKGTGLGLSIVNSIAQENGGFVEFESQQGVGTTFKLWLPALKSGRKPQKRRSSKLAGRCSLTVLYVEDERYIRRNIAHELQDRGLNVILSCDGEGALNAFEQRAHDINLAILDVTMPVINGIEVYRQLRFKKPELPVIFCTAYPTKIHAEGLLSEKDTYLLQKPFKFHALWQVINKATAGEALDAVTVS